MDNGGQCGAARPGRLSHPTSCSGAIISSLTGQGKLSDAVRHAEKSSEEHKPNFTGSFYSKTKAMVEELLKEYKNLCTLRVRMPISSDLNNPRNFITKISHYDKVLRWQKGTCGASGTSPILAWSATMGFWRCIRSTCMDPSYKWTNFTLEEHAKVIVAPRSNNEMDAAKLKREFPELLSIKDSLIKYVFEPNRKVPGSQQLEARTGGLCSDKSIWTRILTV
ncbi:hypothetical protein VPH35_095473 [Triticum aestivum]|uniref:Uncharacterized protein n=1 Tax=Aegilops tauschii TaxID=37682 RepID=M8BHW8_AEGTA